ncbi:alpha/beta hydrolase [Isoptericola cucumis]|uniref:Alpha/beta hydrolase n=1 Tax=Isoptericola cucumis TaxID=1776856 RepID=A0ABQ2B4U9_9MICO|nr:alpha/beta fold hydrolase [Isoptericola cucumis]GGI05097.1 alpha/beta hydrolase [Isoptericola cucumis]
MREIAVADELVELTVDDTPVTGHVYTTPPDPGSGPRPAVVLCTGFSGTQDTPSIVAAAEAFARAGFVATTFDYRSFGTSGGTPRQVVTVPGQLRDIRAVVAHVRARPDVAADRVALWGSSLGGGHVLTIAAEDPGVAAVVAQVPFNGFPRRVEGRSARHTARLLGAILLDAARGRLGRPPVYAKAVGRPDELAVMVSPEAERTIEVLTSHTWRNEVAARSLLSMMRYRPGDGVGRIRAPLLVCLAEGDRETGASTNAHLADTAPRGTLRTYPVTHFDVYRPEVRARLLQDQTDFLLRAGVRPGC